MFCFLAYSDFPAQFRIFSPPRYKKAKGYVRIAN
jgi:hypothetical protein